MSGPLPLLLLALSTYVSEDAAVLAGAFLGASGMLAWSALGFACFLGIWSGDLLLYAAGRHGGRPLLRHPVLRRWLPPAAWEKGEAWVARRGAWALGLSRLVPGTRLPVYLASGLLRYPFRKFAGITALMAAAWVGVLFGLVRVFGFSVAEGLKRVSHQTLAAAAICVVLAGMVVLLRRMAFRWSEAGLPPGLARFRRWEFWPSWLFYLPVGLNYARLACKYRGLNLPSAANPGMATGGLVGESKFATLRGLMDTSPAFTAASALIHEGSLEARLCAFRQSGLALPAVLKPDVGQRGSGFKVIRTLGEAARYLAGFSGPVVLQEYVPGPHEVGLFYYRFPGEESGRIFAVTEKIFPVVFGDGVRTLEQLIRGDVRASLMADVYLQRWEGRKLEVLPFGQSFRLVEAGNHAQGCIFRDGRRLWSEQLEARVDEIARRLDGFYIGRFDVRYESEAGLRRGQGFKILELNGASSEATSIYDARNSLAEAYRVLFRQWELVFAIGAANRARGFHGDSLALLWKEWRRYEAARAAHPIAD
jgi:membrane protein DedA with SNARE-associated domain